MKSLSSWLLAMFMFMFWVFRVIIAYQGQYDLDFGGFSAFNMTVEVILLFVVIVCMVLFIRRKLLGGIIYLISYGYYFGGYIVTNALPALLESEELSASVLQNTFISAIGLILAVCVVFDLLVGMARKKDPKDKKTDWYFQEEKYDRKYDERADRNQYKNY